MKKAILMFVTLFVFGVIGFGNINATPKKKWFERDSRIEIVNENTIIFRDVVKIEIRTNNQDQITYVYDLTHSKLVKVARGTFNVDLACGNYLVQSDKKITKTIYEVIVE